jgi:hypothetical protein
MNARARGGKLEAMEPGQSPRRRSPGIAATPETDSLLQIARAALPIPPELPSRPFDLRGLRGIGGIRSDYDYKSLRAGKARA